MKYFKKLLGDRIYLSPRRIEDAEKFTEWMNDFEITDYNGVTEHVHCPSGIYLENASFTIGLSDEYTQLIEYMHKGYVTQSFK